MDITRIRRAIAASDPDPVPAGWWRRAAQVQGLDPEAVLTALATSVEAADALFPAEETP